MLREVQRDGLSRHTLLHLRHTAAKFHGACFERELWVMLLCVPGVARRNIARSNSSGRRAAVQAKLSVIWQFGNG